MIKKLKLPSSLNAKMLYVCVGGLLLALAVFLLINRLGMLLVDRVYMSDDAVKQRKNEIYSDFSAYVKANSVSGRDSLSVAKWTDGQPFVTVVIFGRGADHRRFHNGKTEQENGVHSSYDYHNYGTLYLVRFEDGLYQVAISDTSDMRQRGIVRASSVFTAFFAFILLYMWYTRRLTGRIIKLSKDAAEVSSGELEKVISSDGSDEIAALALSMDEMRRSVMQRMGNESRAWEANAELITAISHDIRTPMTSMLGYLGLLNDSGFEDKERCRQFTASAYAKAMDLKELTDELFRYFLVYGKAELELSLESYDGRLLLEQLLGEAEFDLIDSGFRVQRIEFKGECSVSADPLYLKRTLDNMISNIKKYAAALVQDFPGTVTLFFGTTVLSVEPNKAAHLSGDRQISFSQLILATGSREIPLGALPIAGTRPKGVYTAGQMQEMMNLHGFVPQGPVVILGSGDIGLIMASQIAAMGISVTLVEQKENCGGLARNRRCLKDNSIRLICSQTIDAVEGSPALTGCCLSGGEKIACRTLLIAAGLVPERGLLAELGMPSWLQMCGNCNTVYPTAEGVTADGRKAGIAAFQKIRGKL